MIGQNQVSLSGGAEKTRAKCTTTENVDTFLLVGNKTEREMTFCEKKTDKSPDCQKDVRVHVEKAEERKNPSGKCWMPH